MESKDMKSKIRIVIIDEIYVIRSKFLITGDYILICWMSVIVCTFVGGALISS